MAQKNESSITAWTALDASNSRFVNLDPCYFVESCACNDAFDTLRGDGKKNIYLAVQDASIKLSIRSMNVLDDAQTLAQFQMNVTLADGTERLTSFGSRLTDTGVLWLCIFNRNTVLGIDLKLRCIIHEFHHIPCPNSISLCPTDANVLYVAGGSAVHGTDDLIAVLPTVGCIYELRIKEACIRAVDSSSLGALSGIQVIRNTMYISQLVNVVRAPLDHTSTLCMSPIWHGTDTSDNSVCYFADTISAWSDQVLVVAMYRTIDANLVPSVQNNLLCSVGWCIAKLATTVVNYFTGAPNELNNAELLLQFSTSDTFHDVHFVLLRVDGRRWQFKLDMSTLKVPAGCEFDGHVTHVQRYGGKVVFVNFKSNYVLLLDESVVVDAMK